ncbi:glycosyltransferase family 4 protein [Metabacillus indicus]|uniref:glycosyltransferase family 4 protein n=1 Tax=Metabacillus indicus TaxID=246786 RepID=UPI0024913235|nr:glycosyltransferase family 4 protein [Metabacillus indicus]
MNVLITESGSKFGKGNRFELYSKIRDMGHTVCVLNQNIQEAYVDEDGDKHFPLDNVPLRNNNNPWKELKFIYTLKNILKNGEIDCILVYGIKIIPSMVLAAKLAGIKKCVPVINGAGQLFMRNTLKVKILNLIALPMLKIAFNLSDKVLIQNQDDYDMLTRSHLIKRNKAYRTNGSGVNLNIFEEKPLSIDNNFLLITRLTSSKGIHEFIDAATLVKSKYPTARFHLVGPKDDLDGSINWDKVQAAISNGIIIYHGPTKDVAHFIRECRVFVFPSYYREGVPRAVLEAMAMGRPIITTDSPGCRETVEDGVNGFLVEPRNSNVLAEKILWIIEHSDLTGKMGKKSREIAEKKFDINNVNKIVLSAIIN